MWRKVKQMQSLQENIQTQPAMENFLSARANNREEMLVFNLQNVFVQIVKKRTVEKSQTNAIIIREH